MTIRVNLRVISVLHGKNVSDFICSISSYQSPTSQIDFEVRNLPNITFPLPRNWAGNIPVDRPGHPNDTLFFWAFEKDHGSLTSVANERSGEPWGIWLNGG